MSTIIKLIYYIIIIRIHFTCCLALHILVLNGLLKLLHFHSNKNLIYKQIAQFERTRCTDVHFEHLKLPGDDVKINKSTCLPSCWLTFDTRHIKYVAFIITN